MTDHLLSIDKGIYLPEHYENLLEFEISPLDLYEENLKSLSELNSELVLLCNTYKGTSDPNRIRLLNESAIERIYDYMQKVSNDCQKYWDKFKNAKNTEKIISVVNKANQPYFQTGFRMQFPTGFNAPLIDKWNRLKTGVRVVVLDESTFNTNKTYMDTEENFKKRFYKNFYDDNYDDFYDNWTKDIFVRTTGREVIGYKEVAQFVNFLHNYNSEIDDIGKDIDNINKSNTNIKRMLSSIPVSEAYDIINGITIGSKFKDVESIQANRMGKIAKAKDKQEMNLKKAQAKNDKKYLITYYSVSMEVLSSKIKICDNIKNQSLKILKKYVAIQPKQIKNNPELGSKYAEMQAQRNVNPNFQIKK